MKPHAQFAVFLLFCSLSLHGQAQSPLARKISLQASRRPLAEILKELEHQGHFRFSYNSSILPADSLVSLDMPQNTVAEALDHVLSHRYEYREAQDFIIIRYAPRALSLLVRESSGNAEEYAVSGQVIDKTTGKPIHHASVYEKKLLQSTLTDAHGFFSLRLKNNPGTIALTVSKENYHDLTTHFLSEVTVSASRGQERPVSIWGYQEGDENSQIERTFWGRWLIASRQRIQSINIGNFIATIPFQASISPGLSSHGGLSGQVVNKFSINATGGYTAGVDGMEIGLAFNINKGSVRWLQLAGGFNLVGGSVRGLQAGGFYNQIYQNVSGMQLSLGANRLGGSLRGFQVGGLYNGVRGDALGVQVGIGLNDVRRTFDGVQIGLANYTAHPSKGLQLAAGANLARQYRGVQVAGLLNYATRFNGLRLALLANVTRGSAGGFQLAPVNYARKLEGFQLGLINIADSSSAHSIGLLNIVRKGLHQLEVGANETIPLNVTLKTGTRRLYTLITAGRQAPGEPAFLALGFGLGKALMPGKHLAIHAELSTRYLYQGDWQQTNLLNRLDLKVQYKLTNWLALNAGPAFNIYYSEQAQALPGYGFLGRKGQNYDLGWQDYRAWMGWSAGIVLF